jgi:hypothetical protein
MRFKNSFSQPFGVTTYHYINWREKVNIVIFLAKKICIVRTINQFCFGYINEMPNRQAIVPSLLGVGLPDLTAGAVWRSALVRVDLAEILTVGLNQSHRYTSILPCAIDTKHRSILTPITVR